MAVPGLTVSANVSANNIAVTGVLRSGTQPHGNTVTVSRAGEQTTGDTTSTAYTITTQNSIGGVTANVTQQTGFSSTIDGSDNLISYASVAGQGVNFHAFSPDNVTYGATTDTPSHSTIAASTNAPAPTGNATSPASVAAASTNAPPAPPPAPVNTQTQSSAVQATAATAPANGNPSAPPPIASYSNSNNVPTQTASAPSAPPSSSNSGSNQDTSSGGYTALANTGASTIRGSTLNVVT